jgi:hypothetical protein
MLGQTLVLTQMTFLNNVRKVGKISSFQNLFFFVVVVLGVVQSGCRSSTIGHIKVNFNALQLLMFYLHDMML